MYRQFFYLSLLLLFSCQEDPKANTMTDVYWEPQMSVFFEEECGLCHDDPPLASPIPLKTYAQVKGKLDRIAIRALVSNDMPPGGLSTQSKKDLLQHWINQGAPEKNNHDMGTIDMLVKDQEVDDLDHGQIKVTWQSHIQGVFSRYCNGCHNDPTAGGAPYPLTRYDDVIVHLDEIRESVIQVGSMPPPNGLQDEEVFNLILTWLDNGALEY